MAERSWLRDLFWIAAATLVLRGIAAILVPWTPYLDSSYYTLVAERLATGDGFTVPGQPAESHDGGGQERHRDG